MFQKVLRVFRALDGQANAKPVTARGWLLFLVAHAVRWTTTQAQWAWRKVRDRPPRYPIVRPYVNPRHPARVIARILSPIALALACIVYGFMFGLTAPYLLIPFAVPIVILVLLAIWALPEAHNAPTKSMEITFAAVLISLLVWPNYLALSLPGLPWITAIRLFTVPLAFLFLISLSSSSRFRGELAQALRAAPGLWLLLTAFIVIQFATVPLSKSPSDSFTTVTNAQLNWTMLFLVGAWVAQQPGKANNYINLFIFLSLPMCIIAMFEASAQYLLWINNVPPFLKIDDVLAAKYMAAVTRDGVYRVKSVYASPLSFAEALALLTPFCIHIATQKYRVSYRVLAFLLIPTFFMCIRFTDARLGILGMLVSVLAYFLLWALLQLGRNARSLLAAAVVYAYPAAIGAATLAVLFVYRIRVLVLGGGAQASSDDARRAQVEMGIPKILSHPQGYGAGNAAETLGYAPFGMITIDNYYLSVALDYGVLGFIAFYGMFIAAIVAAIRVILKSPAALDTPEKTLLIPLTVSMTVFVVVRSVLSQEDNHVLAFALFGLLVGVLSQVKQTAKAQAEAHKAAADEVRPALVRRRITPQSRKLGARSATIQPRP